MEIKNTFGTATECTRPYSFEIRSSESIWKFYKSPQENWANGTTVNATFVTRFILRWAFCGFIAGNFTLIIQGHFALLNLCSSTTGHHHTVVYHDGARSSTGRSPLRWRHNGRDGVSRNSPGTGEFPAQMASNAENVSISWRHHVKWQIKQGPAIPLPETGCCYYKRISIQWLRSHQSLEESSGVTITQTGLICPKAILQYINLVMQGLDVWSW